MYSWCRSACCCRVNVGVGAGGGWLLALSARITPISTISAHKPPTTIAAFVYHRRRCHQFPFPFRFSPSHGTPLAAIGWRLARVAGSRDRLRKGGTVCHPKRITYDGMRPLTLAGLSYHKEPTPVSLETGPIPLLTPNVVGAGFKPAPSHTRNYSRWDYNGEANISATAIVSPGTAAVVNASLERYSVSVV